MLNLPFFSYSAQDFAKGMVLSSLRVVFLQLAESRNHLTKLCHLQESTSSQAGSKYQSSEVKNSLCQLDIEAF